MNSNRTFLRLALIAALTASLGLAACGRKGPLDLPPGASSVAEPQNAQASAPSPVADPVLSPFGSQPNATNTGVGPEGRPQAPKGPNKRIPLDTLLN